MRARSTTAAAVIAMTLGLFSEPGKGAELSLNETLSAYDHAGVTAEERTSVLANLANIERAFGWANSALRAQRMRRRALYCLPDDLVIEPHELMDMLRDAAWDEPRLGDRPIGFAVLLTLQRAFPCK